MDAKKVKRQYERMARTRKRSSGNQIELQGFEKGQEAIRKNYKDLKKFQRQHERITKTRQRSRVNTKE